MRISHTLPDTCPRPTVVALGFFDGVHLGHRAVIREAKARAQALDCDCAVFTFSQSPRNIFSPGSVSVISSEEDKTEALRSLDVDWMLSLPFDEEIRGMTPKEFFDTVLLGCLHARHLVCGYNYSFGAGGSGDVSLLRTLCEAAKIGLTVLPDVTVSGISVSSSTIRHAVREGRMEEAEHLLGRPFSLSLPVIDGQKLARRLGFPTMNQKIEAHALTPKHGVYVTRVRLPHESAPHFGITNVGHRPTVGGGEIFAETHIFDFEGNLYEQKIPVEFLTFLRPEKPFSSVEALAEQVKQDIESARQYLAEHFPTQEDRA